MCARGLLNWSRARTLTGLLCRPPSSATVAPPHQRNRRRLHAFWLRHRRAALLAQLREIKIEIIALSEGRGWTAAGVFTSRRGTGLRPPKGRLGTVNDLGFGPQAGEGLLRLQARDFMSSWDMSHLLLSAGRSGRCPTNFPNFMRFFPMTFRLRFCRPTLFPAPPRVHDKLASGSHWLLDRW